MTPRVVWFRLDLRLQDNPALHAAIARGGAVIPAFKSIRGAGVVERDA